MRAVLFRIIIPVPGCLVHLRGGEEQCLADELQNLPFCKTPSDGDSEWSYPTVALNFFSDNFISQGVG